MNPLRLLAVIEARTITGPAKNLLEFARLARDLGVETGIATFVRGDAVAGRFAPQVIQTHAVKSHLLARLAESEPWRRELTAAGLKLVRERYDWTTLGESLWNTYQRWLEQAGG